MLHSTKIRGLKYILICTLILASITMPARLKAQPPPAEKEWVVVIDAGHGGKDPGTVGPKSREKNINLSVALKTGKYIKENLKDVKVIYTRDNDTFIELDERANVANKNKADIFISIHSNWISDSRVKGAETFVLGQSKNEANLQVAMKENSVITFEKDYQTKYEGYDPNSVESFIIFSLMQNTYLKQSTEVASMIQSQFRDRVGRRDRGVKQAGFLVLRGTTMPAVLVELGFVSNPEEEKYLLSEEGQDYLASAIYRAFRDYKQSIDSRSGRKNGNIITIAETKQEEPAIPARVDSTVSQQELPRETIALPLKETLAEPADDIYFMVQIFAMPKGREPDKQLLKDIETVTRIEDGERVKYTAGKFTIYDDALKYRRTITTRFSDAFVIAVRNGKIMPLREAIDSKKKN